MLSFHNFFSSSLCLRPLHRHQRNLLSSLIICCPVTRPWSVACFRLVWLLLCFSSCRQLLLPLTPAVTLQLSANKSSTRRWALSHPFPCWSSTHLSLCHRLQCFLLLFPDLLFPFSSSHTLCLSHLLSFVSLLHFFFAPPPTALWVDQRSLCHMPQQPRSAQEEQEDGILSKTETVENLRFAPQIHLTKTHMLNHVGEDVCFWDPFIRSKRSCVVRSALKRSLAKWDKSIQENAVKLPIHAPCLIHQNLEKHFTTQ